MSRRAPVGGKDGATRTGRALALLAVAIIVAVVLLGHVGTTSSGGGSTQAAVSTHAAAPTTTLPPQTTTTSTVPPTPPSQIKLLVLNGTGKGSLAGETSKKLAASPGYNTLAPDNTTSTVTGSTIYAVSPQYVAAGQALAATLKLPSSVVQTPLPAAAPVRTSERSIADLILIIGPDLAAQAATGGSTTVTTAAG